MIIHMLQKSDLKEELPPCIHLSVAYTISFFSPFFTYKKWGRDIWTPILPVMPLSHKTLGKGAICVS